MLRTRSSILSLIYWNKFNNRYVVNLYLMLNFHHNFLIKAKSSYIYWHIIYKDVVLRTLQLWEDHIEFY